MFLNNENIEIHMNERPTPETDAEVTSYFEKKHPPIVCYHELAKFARRLERERDDLLDRLTALEHSMPVELANLERERDEARDTIVDVLSALKPMHNEGPRLAALRVKEERDEALDAVEKSKAFKRVMKEDNAKLRQDLDKAQRDADTFLENFGKTQERAINAERELDELNKRLIEICQYGVVCTIEREDLHNELDEAREKLAAERALADRLANSVTACERWVNQPCDVKTEANKALIEWKEARK